MSNEQWRRWAEFGLAATALVVILTGLVLAFVQSTWDYHFQKRLLGVFQQQYRWQDPGVSLTGVAVVAVGALMMLASLASAARAQVRGVRSIIPWVRRRAQNRTAAPANTMAAEGLPRRRFTVAEIERMTALGIFEEDERIELIGGEIVPMMARGDPHEILKTTLNLYWAARLPPDLLFTTETTFRLSVDAFLEPGFVFYPKASAIPGLSAANAKLVVELSDSSLAYDLGRKAGLYAGFGIAELWVIDAVRLTTRIHRAPRPDGYGTLVDLAADQALVPAAVPALAVTLADLELH